MPRGIVLLAPIFIKKKNHIIWTEHQGITKLVIEQLLPTLTNRERERERSFPSFFFFNPPNFGQIGNDRTFTLTPPYQIRGFACLLSRLIAYFALLKFPQRN
jgi:hypothetical protein